MVSTPCVVVALVTTTRGSIAKEKEDAVCGLNLEKRHYP